MPEELEHLIVLTVGWIGAISFMILMSGPPA